jgi:superfamily II DNA/RNA helicase
MSTVTPPTFASLGVPDFICRALEQRGIVEPFEIQAVTVADVLAGRDVCGRAPTGSGKTLAFGVPMVAMISEAGRAAPGRPKALILAPTRELAEQITNELRSFGGRLRIDAVYGGVGYGPQLNALKRGIDILVACPGRLEDLIERRDVNLSDVGFVVLDEADRMADMGFMPSVRRLLDRTAKKRQTVLFSATLDGDIAKLTKEYQTDPVRHEVGEETPDIKAAEHRFWKVDKTGRTAVTADIVMASWPSIIFTRTRHGADRLAKQLAASGVQTAPIHGGRSQGQRMRALEDFTKGRVHALVATDVAARGIHVDGVNSVIHFDPPEDHKAYVHRSGRTARAGESGLVVSLLSSDQFKDARKMQRDVGLEETITEPDVRNLPAATLAGDRQLKAGAPAKRVEDRGGDNRPRNQHGRQQRGEAPRLDGTARPEGRGRDGEQTRASFPRAGGPRKNSGSGGNYRGNNPRSAGTGAARPRTGR